MICPKSVCFQGPPVTHFAGVGPLPIADDRRRVLRLGCPREDLPDHLRTAPALVAGPADLPPVAVLRGPAPLRCRGGVDVPPTPATQDRKARMNAGEVRVRHHLVLMERGSLLSRRVIQICYRSKTLFVAFCSSLELKWVVG